MRSHAPDTLRSITLLITRPPRGRRVFFTVPEVLVAGMPARFYFNRARPWGFASQPNVKLHYGWNAWDDKVLHTHALTDCSACLLVL